MNSHISRNIFLILFSVLIFITGNVSAQVKPVTGKDSIPTRFLLNENRLPFQSTENPRGMNMKLPSNFNKSVEYDPTRNEYIFKEKVGKLDYRLPYSLTMQEYRQYEAKNAMKSYWSDRRKGDKGEVRQSFIPKLNVGGEAFDKIFGSNVINIVPQGSAELIFGITTSKINNPNISERLRKTTTFDFKEKIQMNVTGNIGDKMKLGVNYNTEATFDFENKTKLEYTGKEDEIIKKIEAGNVTLPLSGSLITGSQSLFGLKTELQFGKLTVTTVLSQQKGESSVIEVKGGAQVNQFEVPIDQYDANKHFFIAHYFRDRYEEALRTLPIINSGFTITKIEVWITNKSSTYENSRNIVAFLDLAEENKLHIYNKIPGFGYKAGRYPQNDANYLYDEVIKSYHARDIQQVSNSLSPLASDNFRIGQDFEKIENARKLTEREFTFHPTLGYISLNSALNADEILAVAYEYTFQGKSYKVGELSTSGISAPGALVVKLLKGTNFTPKLPNWNLMMKNVYSINAYQVNRDNFQLHVLYQDDKNGTAVNYIPETQTSNDILLRVLRLDNVNTNLDPSPDGVFDFIEGVTINSSNGRIYFPMLEPFGSTMQKYLDKAGLPQSASQKYVFKELYDSTQTKARQVAEKNKFKLKGTYQSSSASDIPLNALNVPQGSVVVTASGRKLTENIDYTVDYTLGRVKIINQGLLESGTPIKISLESNSLFNFQTKTLIGSHLDYKFSDNFHLGATVLNLTERPLTQKVNIGDEPVSNTIWGINGTYTTKSQLLTTLIDKLPLIQTKEPSSIIIDGEFAQLIPGSSSAINGTAYIDDFEGSETSIDMRSYQTWTLASAPQDLTLFPESSLNNDLHYGFNRAKLSWYVIDPLFLRNNSATPTHIRNDKDSQSSHFVREVFESDIFKGKENPSGLPSNIPILNIAYYPNERGPYNYDATGVNPDGTLNKPDKRWGGIQREVQTNDFEAANVEFIEFWLMDPFLEDSAKKNKGGNLYFNLGNVSEDVLKDSRKSFENGLPTPNSPANIDTSSVWGRIPTSQSLVSAFDNDPVSRPYQDVGLDGLNNNDEDIEFKGYLDALAKNVGAGSKAYLDAFNDPSTDDFKYYRDSYYDSIHLGILERYKKYNGLENNSPAQTSASDFAASGSSLPNTEDINRDNTLSENESFFQYKVEIKPEKLKIGSNFIVDSVVYVAKFPNGKKSAETWFQFRIPITEYQKTVGSIQDFKSIRFMRMFLNGFNDSVIMRFARLDLVRGEWRKYNLSFRQGGETLSSPEENDGTFEISAVNIENNGTKKPVNYVLPPGITRQIDPQNPQLLQLNEQSMVLKVQDLVNGDARAAYKNINLDIRQYKRLKMEVHAEQILGKFIDQKELTVFIRMGSDYKDNYYEYEVPLNLTTLTGKTFDNNNDADRLLVWPAENKIDISMDELQQVKQARNDEMRRLGTNVTQSTIFSYPIEGRKYFVCGNPNLSNVRTIMIGVRYPYDSNKLGQTRSVEVWVDELRLTDFNEKGGWAANLRTSIRLADLGMINASGSYSTPGFGSIEKKVSQRSKDEIIQYDVSTNLELGKFFPKKSGVQIPMYVGISETVLNPLYNPLDPDIELKAALNNAKSAEERAKIKRNAEDRTTRKSLNFTNVKINKQSGKPHFYDVSNLSLSYSYSELNSHNISTQYNIQKRYFGGLMYNFQNRPKNITPFQKVKLFNQGGFRLIKDFNFSLMPTSISFRTDMNRNYNETTLRNLNDPTMNILVIPMVNKDFTWNRYFTVSYDLTRALKLDFASSNLARIDEDSTRFGVVSRAFKDDYQRWKEGVWRNIQGGGRTVHYQHDINITYTIPINKLPFLDWTSASARYSTTYDWDAAPLVANDSLALGNTINNTGTIQLNGQLNLTSLYNKVPYFRKLMQPKNNSKQAQQKKYKTVTYERDRALLTANEPRMIYHKLSTEDVKVKVTDANGQEIVGKMQVIDANKVSFTADKDYMGTKIVVEGKVEVKPSPLIIIVENLTRAILGIKNVSVSWSKTDGTTLPGFMPRTQFLGMGSSNSMYAPGLPFILGFQDKNFPDNHKEWLTQSLYLNTPYLMSHNDNLNLRSTIEPFPGFKIEVNASRSYTQSQRSNYTFPYTPDTRNMQESGNFSMTFISIGSAFDKISSSDGFNSKTFRKFQDYRSRIANRLGTDREIVAINSTYNKYDVIDEKGHPLPPGEINGYGISSQEVLIPAFMAAYGGISPNKVTLDKFPSIFKMLPNWRINYEGLSKIEFFQKFARTVSLNHAYRATYNVGNYLTNPDYGTETDIQGMLSTFRDLQQNYSPRIDISSVSITEQFGPLISMDINFKNSLSSKLEIRRNRNLILSLANNQLTETSSNELIVGAGYKFNNVQFIIKSAGGEKKFKSDLNLRADLSIRDNKTIIRRLTDEPDQPAQGQNIVTIKVSADYMLSDRFNLRMFYDRIVNTPLVSLSYPTANTNIGFSVRFTLAQ